jgi:hypothetical protein
LPDRKLINLREAADYITGLPKKEAALPEWQAAIEALMLVVEQRGPTMFARIAVMKALNRHVERVFNPERKDTHWVKRKLKRAIPLATGLDAVQDLAGDPQSAPKLGE